MPLPHNFTFFIGGRHDLKYFSDRKINYFIGFNHPGWSEPYEKDEIVEKLGVSIDNDNIHLFSVHDAFTKAHREMGLKMPSVELIDEILKHAWKIKAKLDKGEEVRAGYFCAAGISRSTATCYIILCYLLGEWNEREALNLLVNKRPIARPNPLMVKIADDLMGRKYKMVSPLHNSLDLERETDENNSTDILLF